MKCHKADMRLYAVTATPRQGQSLYNMVEAALKHGVNVVQLREKTLPKDELVALGKSLVPLCHSYGVPLIVNDSPEIALASGADGVHLGQEDMSPKKAREILGEDKIIGVSAHNVTEALQAVADGADYLGAGAVFTTSTKQNTTPLSFDALRDICHAVDIPVVAIGGITKENILQLKGSGIAGVAVVSALFGADDIGTAADEIISLATKAAKEESLKVIINGEKVDAAGMTVAAYLNSISCNTARVAVEQNGSIVPKAQYNTTVLNDGDEIEIVQFVGGG